MKGRLPRMRPGDAPTRRQSRRMAIRGAVFVGCSLALTWGILAQFRNLPADLEVRVVVAHTGQLEHASVSLHLPEASDELSREEFLRFRSDVLDRKFGERKHRSPAFMLILDKREPGVYRLEGAPALTYILSCLPGNGAYDLREVTFKPGEVNTVNIMAQTPVGVRGKVVDLEGNPVGGASMTVVIVAPTWVDLFERGRVRWGPTEQTHPTGSYVFVPYRSRIPPDKPFVLEVFKPGYVPFVSQVLVGEPGQLIDLDLKVALDPGSTFSGFVVDEEGNRLPRAVLTLVKRPAEDDPEGDPMERLRFLLSTPGAEALSYQRFLTDYNGDFRVSGLTLGRYRLTVRKSGYQAIMHRFELKQPSKRLRVRLKRQE